MPEPPPVTTATFPLRLNKMSQAWKYYTLQLKSTNSVYFIGKVTVRRDRRLWISTWQADVLPVRDMCGMAALYAPATPAHDYWSSAATPSSTVAVITLTPTERPIDR